MRSLWMVIRGSIIALFISYKVKSILILSSLNVDNPQFTLSSLADLGCIGVSSSAWRQTEMKETILLPYT